MKSPNLTVLNKFRISTLRRCKEEIEAITPMYPVAAKRVPRKRNRVASKLYIYKYQQRTISDINTLRTGAFKLFKCTFPGSKQFKSTFILCFFKNL